MADPAVVATKLQQIEQYHSELQDKQYLSKETFLTSVTEQRAVERMFQNAIQACIDLIQHIATTSFEYDGESSKAAIQILAANDVIAEGTATTLTDAVGFRNILAHEYGHVEEEAVYTYLQTELSLYDEVSQQIAVWFNERTETAGNGE